MASTTITDICAGTSLYSVHALPSYLSAPKDLMLTSDYGTLKDGLTPSRGKN